jgi:hypothetical protein
MAVPGSLHTEEELSQVETVIRNFCLFVFFLSSVAFGVALLLLGFLVPPPQPLVITVSVSGALSAISLTVVTLIDCRYGVWEVLVSLLGYMILFSGAWLYLLIAGIVNYFGPNSTLEMKQSSAITMLVSGSGICITILVAVIGASTSKPYEGVVKDGSRAYNHAHRRRTQQRVSNNQESHKPLDIAFQEAGLPARR